MTRLFSCFAFTLFFIASFAQESAKTEFERHIKYLADDSLEGRATGSKGEKMAYEYLINEFENSNIKPASKGKYLQAFSFYNGMEIGNSTALQIGKSKIKKENFYPLSYSANATLSAKVVNVGFGIEAPELDYNDYNNPKKLNGKIFLIDIANPKANNPHSEFAKHNGINYRIDKAIKYGAAGIIFYNSSNFVQKPDNKYGVKTTRSNIPIVFVNDVSAFDLKKIKKAEITVALNETMTTGNNVIAKIDNNAEHTIILGAHYDHIGWGEYGSRHTGAPAIHNGADDNASGTAMLLELADWLSASDFKSNNYLFVAFSGEELGLHGSKHFVKNAGLDLSDVNYMLNYDMVGRLNEEAVLSVNGVGTSPAWKDIEEISVDGISELKTTESGRGPSDHTSFYLEDIPVLHFFSGVHSDYHKPIDDEEFINYNGMQAIYDFSKALIAKLDEQEKIEFTKTKDVNNRNAPRFTVTLGVMPDYTFAGNGMRIDGVTDGKVASKAGIEKGDVVIKMGEYKVKDMMSYMEALSKFKHGDKTKVKVRRGTEELEYNITF